jgi:hypothetical protein
MTRSNLLRRLHAAVLLALFQLSILTVLSLSAAGPGPRWESAYE